MHILKWLGIVLFTLVLIGAVVVFLSLLGWRIVKKPKPPELEGD